MCIRDRAGFAVVLPAEASAGASVFCLGSFFSVSFFNPPSCACAVAVQMIAAAVMINDLMFDFIAVKFRVQIFSNVARHTIGK